MHDFLKRFWTAVLSVATVLGLFVGALAVHQLWLFWIVLVVGLIAGLAKPILRIAADVITRYRAHGALLLRVAHAEKSLRAATQAIAELRAEAGTEYARGIEDGIARSVGASLARGMTLMPQLTSISVQDGEVALMGRWDSAQLPPVIDSWLSVEVIGTGESKGAVRVIFVDPEARTVKMLCCEKSAPEFWRRLARRAPEDPAPPQGVRLRPYELRPYEMDGGKPSNSSPVKKEVLGE
jgi:hypothetical protein